MGPDSVTPGNLLKKKKQLIGDRRRTLTANHTHDSHDMESSDQHMMKQKLKLDVVGQRPGANAIDYTKQTTHDLSDQTLLAEHSILSPINKDLPAADQSKHQIEANIAQAVKQAKNTYELPKKPYINTQENTLQTVFANNDLKMAGKQISLQLGSTQGNK